VTAIELAVPDLGLAFDGYTIAILADLHQPPHGNVRWLRHAVDLTNAVQPDLVALLGDYGYSVKQGAERSRQWYQNALGTMTHELDRLRATDGLVALLGNHDYYADARLVREWLGALGADVLVNGVRRVTRHGQSLRILGLDDLDEGTIALPSDVDAADRTPTVVLSHNPDVTFVLSEHVRCDVVVAGHTHGGQVVLPLYGAPLTMTRVCKRQWASGWVPNVRVPLYVTRGLGEQLPLPLRINCPPEVLMLRLRSGQQPA
jgi:predicted MPP superfamily phosphohydrolase